MAGNSLRRGAGHRGKNNAAGSGGRIKKSLAGRGPTPKAEDRIYHKAYKMKQAASKTMSSRPRAKATGADWVVGRNPVFEALQAHLPAKGIYIADGSEHDSRMRDILRFSADNSISLMQVSRAELDRMTGGLVHQGVALQLPAYQYRDIHDLIDAGLAADNGLIVALDGITDPRNLGAIVRSAAAFGAQGILIPERRSASMTAAAWKTSAGAAARIPIAMATNLNQSLIQFSKAGFTIVGLEGSAKNDLSDIAATDMPIVLVVGSEGEGLARLVKEHCNLLVSIPIAAEIESLNASVAAAIALYQISQVSIT